jgi:hypothetical protein
MVLRLKAETSSTTAEDIATTIEKHINRRVVVFLLRQRSDDPSDVIITCTNINRTDRAQRRLNEAGYEEGPSPSKDIIVQEGQRLWIKFRGNIRCMDKHISELEFPFNSHLNSSLRFFVADVDQYAQKSSNMYRGFAQIYTHGLVQRAVKIEDKSSTKKKDSVKMELVPGEKLLSELLINLPKVIEEYYNISSLHKFKMYYHWQETGISDHFSIMLITEFLAIKNCFCSPFSSQTLNPRNQSSKLQYNSNPMESLTKHCFGNSRQISEMSGSS